MSGLVFFILFTKNLKSLERSTMNHTWPYVPCDNAELSQIQNLKECCAFQWGRGALTCCICWLLWSNCFHCGWFLVNNVNRLTLKFESLIVCSTSQWSGSHTLLDFQSSRPLWCKSSLGIPGLKSLFFDFASVSHFPYLSSKAIWVDPFS